MTAERTKKLSLWPSAGFDPEEFGDWYKAVGAGMGASLNMASCLKTYALTDRASWLNFGNAADLVLLLEGDDVLFDQYAYLPMNPVSHSHVNYSAAQRPEA